MNEQQIRLFASKRTDDWQTPKWLYNELNAEFGFDFDPCPLNAGVDGLMVSWGKINFVNPPYSKIKAFLQKAWYEIDMGNAQVCVFLTFANTDTEWFHRYIYHRAEIRFLKGRLKFSDAQGKVLNSAMRPSMVCVLKYHLTK